MRPLPPVGNRPLNRIFQWTRHSFYLFSAFVLLCGLIVYVWWPLAEEYLAYIDWNGEWWRWIDWLLIGIFLAMSFLIMARADLRADARLVFVATVGGLVIESWGTQTNLWHYYTAERPPLWIIPAWPIAALSTERLVHLLDWASARFLRERASAIGYGLVFAGFYACLLSFTIPTLSAPGAKSLTWMALILCALLSLTPPDRRQMLLVFIAGAGLGYFLELWGTTRECWTYYTMQKPPFFAVLAHGMASVAFWRTQLILEKLYANRTTLLRRLSAPAARRSPKPGDDSSAV